MLKYTIPLWISMAINTLLGVTDFYFLGQISNHYLSVIGIAYLPFTLLNALIVGFGIETNRSIASGSKIKIWKVYIMAICSSILIVGAALFFVNEIFAFASDNQHIDEIIIYFQKLILLLVPTSLLYVSTGILRGNGKPGKSIYFSIAVVVMNFIFDYLFIKLDFFSSPLKGCAYASIFSDALLVLIYIIYLYKKSYLKVEMENMSVIRFIKNALTYSFEKLFSSSSLTILTGVFVANLSITDSTIYYGVERGLLPITMYSYSYFEWVIYSYSKNIKNSRVKNYSIYLVLLFLGVIFINSYLELNKFILTYCFIYIIYCLLFFIEREIVARCFAAENGLIVNKVIFIKNVLLLICLEILKLMGQLNLFSMVITQIVLIIIESVVLIKKDTSFKSVSIQAR